MYQSSPDATLSPEPLQLEALVQLAEEMAGPDALARQPEKAGDPLVRLGRSLSILKSQREESQREQRESEESLHRAQGSLRALRAATRVAESVASAFEKELVLAAVPDALIRTFGAATARVWLVERGDRCLSCPQARRCADRTRCLHLVPHGERGPLDLALLRVPIGGWSVGQVAERAELVSTNDLSSDASLCDPDWARVERVRAFAGHPLLHEGRLLGVVAMWSRAPIREDMHEALRILSRQASTAIAGAELLEAVRAESARTQDAMTRLSAVLDAERNGVVLLDGDDSTAYVNDAFRKLFALGDQPLLGLGQDQLEALLTEQLIHDGGRDASPAATLKILPVHPPGDSISREAEEFRIQRPGDLAPRIFQRYTAPVRSPFGAAQGWMAVFDDVTAAREGDRMKSEFISSVSHELRTPLTSILAALALLLDGTTELDAEAAELLRLSKRNADRLLRRVSDFLDVSQLDAGKVELQLEPVSVLPLFAEAESPIAVFLKKRGVELRVEVPAGLPEVSADRKRLLQILNNLLSNAIKFSPRGGTVFLRARLQEATGKEAEPACLRFEIADQGPGIALAFRDKLFTRFAQSQRAEREQAGTGLGLAICDALVKRHGGSIGCESVPGRGATFFFTLPLANCSPIAGVDGRSLEKEP